MLKFWVTIAASETLVSLVELPRASEHIAYTGWNNSNCKWLPWYITFCQSLIIVKIYSKNE